MNRINCPSRLPKRHQCRRISFCLFHLGCGIHRQQHIAARMHKRVEMQERQRTTQHDNACARHHKIQATQYPKSRIQYTNFRALYATYWPIIGFGYINFRAILCLIATLRASLFRISTPTHNCHHFYRYEIFIMFLNEAQSRLS